MHQSLKYLRDICYIRDIGLILFILRGEETLSSPSTKDFFYADAEVDSLMGLLKMSNANFPMNEKAAVMKLL